MAASKSGKSTICLNMIVKNEAHVIKRCLESVLPYIDTWVISDTGSTDGTQALILDIMKDVPGELVEREWRDFGHNRDEVLQMASDKADYSLIIDADEWLECEKGFDFSNLNQDSYYIIKRQINKDYWVRNIVKNGIGWRWKDVIHEYLVCENASGYGDIEGAIIQVLQEGARALDPMTYRKDAGILTSALATDPDNTRYQFYLAQSWRDAKEDELAITNYKKRLEMGGWEEEEFISHYEIANAMKRMNQPWPETLAQYLKAWEHTPQRAEPLYQIGSHYMEAQNWASALLFLKQASEIEKPVDLMLFLQDAIYDYMSLIDAAVSAGNLGNYDEMRKLHKTLFKRKNVPEDMIQLAKNNQNYFEGLETKKKDKAA